MPLIHSPAKKPFEHNVKTELESGKPMKQALAIAYNTKRMAQKKKMAQGGMISKEREAEFAAAIPSPDDRPQDMYEKKRYLAEKFEDQAGKERSARAADAAKESAYQISSADSYAHGGYVSDDDEAMELKPDFEDEDEISDELGPAKALSLKTYPDEDNTEHEIFPPLYSGANPNNPERLEEKRKGMLSKILADIRLRNVRGK